MGDNYNVSSDEQEGGITAGRVDISRDFKQSSQSPPVDEPPTWLKTCGIVFSIIGVIGALIFGFLQMWKGAE